MYSRAHGLPVRSGAAVDTRRPLASGGTPCRGPARPLALAWLLAPRDDGREGDRLSVSGRLRRGPTPRSGHALLPVRGHLPAPLRAAAAQHRQLSARLPPAAGAAGVALRPRAVVLH